MGHIYKPEACPCVGCACRWFVVCFQLVTCVTALWAVVAGKVNTYRAGLIGLFIVATVLNIQASDSWLNVSYTEVFSHDMLRDRTRTTVAGYIMWVSRVQECFCDYRMLGP
jgi:hypothetical protein